MAKDPLLSNKIMGALLVAGVIATGSGFASKLVYTSDELEQNAYPIEVAGVDTDSTADSAPVDTLLWAEVARGLEGAQTAGGDMLAGLISDGQKVFKKCSACHNIVSGAAHKTGPNLWNVYGRQIATVEGYKYSGALEGISDRAWTDEELNAFLANPKEYAPGTKMSYKGLKKVSDRVAMLLFLDAQTDQ